MIITFLFTLGFCKSIVAPVRSQASLSNVWPSNLVSSDKIKLSPYGRKLFASSVATVQTTPIADSLNALGYTGAVDHGRAYQGNVTLVGYSHFVVNDAFNKWLNANEGEAKSCVTLIHEGRKSEARSRLEKGLIAYKGSSFADPLLELVIEMDGWKAALALGKSYIESSKPPFNFLDDSILFKISLAAAMSGEIFEGQRDYCVKSLLRSLDKDGLPLLPAGNSQADLVSLSALAVSKREFGHGEYGLALKYATLAEEHRPRSAAVAMWDGFVLGVYGQFSKAAAVIDQGISNATSDPSFQKMMMFQRDAYRKELAEHGDRIPPELDQALQPHSQKLTHP